MLDELSNKMDDTIDKYGVANARLKQLLDEASCFVSSNRLLTSLFLFFLLSTPLKLETEHRRCGDMVPDHHSGRHFAGCHWLLVHHCLEAILVLFVSYHTCL